LKVSFVIPTLNSEKTLRACLHSILAQNLPRNSYEIVVADVGSSDATVEIARGMGGDQVVGLFATQIEAPPPGRGQSRELCFNAYSRMLRDEEN